MQKGNKLVATGIPPVLYSLFANLGTRGKELTITKVKPTKTTIELDKMKKELSNSKAKIEGLKMTLEEKDKQLTKAKNDLNTAKKISKAKDKELSTLADNSKKQAPLCHNVSTSKGKKKSKTLEKNVIAHSMDAKLEGMNLFFY